MNLLLDTHVALWAITDSQNLLPKARDLITPSKTTVWISAATIWEITIKHSLGGGDMSVSGEDAMRNFSGSRLSFFSDRARTSNSNGRACSAS